MSHTAYCILCSIVQVKPGRINHSFIHALVVLLHDSTIHYPGRSHLTLEDVMMCFQPQKKQSDFRALE